MRRRRHNNYTTRILKVSFLFRIFFKLIFETFIEKQKKIGNAERVCLIFMANQKSHRYSDKEFFIFDIILCFYIWRWKIFWYVHTLDMFLFFKSKSFKISLYLNSLWSFFWVDLKSKVEEKINQTMPFGLKQQSRAW